MESLRASTDIFYLLACRECGQEDPPGIGACGDGHPLIMPFGSAEARGKWAAEHTHGTGHDRWWVSDQPRGGHLDLEGAGP